MKNKNSRTSVSKRCQFQFSDARCCRMLRSPAHSSLCAFDARQELQLREDDMQPFRICDAESADPLAFGPYSLTPLESALPENSPLNPVE